MKKRNINISVIVPIYNVERYISFCVDSIINQTIEPYEIILIDDGSTDNSGKICDRYKENTKIIVIHQTNTGLSNARNVGISVSRGEYIYFVDGDDWIENNSLEIFSKLLENNKVDCVFGREKFYDEKSGEIEENSFFVDNDGAILSGVDTFVKARKRHRVFHMGVRGIYNSSFIKNNNLYFENGILFEDQEWTIRMLIKAKTVLGVDKSTYCYRKNRLDSITNTNNIKNCLDAIYIYNKYSQIVCKEKDNKHFISELKKELGFRYINLFWYAYYHLKKEDKEKFYILYDKNIHIIRLTYLEKIKDKLIYIGLLFIGSKNIDKIYKKKHQTICYNE